MSPKILLIIRSLFLKNIGLVLFLLSFKAFSQKTITEIHTDWKGYWKSNSTTGVGNRPDTENNLLAFTWDAITYSTGVNDNILDTRGVTYSAQKFRALKIQTLGIDASSMYMLQGSMIDGSASTATLVPPLTGATATGAELASRLTDGVNGLTVGTGVANIKAGVAEFKVGTNNLNLTGIGDGIPDIIVTQVADPGSGLADKFKFIDASGNTVGTEISVAFGTVNPIGTYSLDLFKMDGTYGFTPASTRDIRMLGIETSSFGITTSNASQVDRFVVTFSGSSDCAFIAFNTKSLKLAELGLVKKASMTSCAKLGDQITYTFEITNTGDVPLTNIKLTDPMAGMNIPVSTIANLASKQTVTLTGTYTVTAADVAAGIITNSAKVVGTDPSLNVVEDISGQTNGDNVATVTTLLAAPTVGTITNTTCSSLGTVVLNNLPSTGTWTLERSPASATPYTGTGTSTTITGLAVGSYTFRVTNSEGCKSPATPTITITNQSATTWNGSSWSGGTPDATKNVVFAGAYTISADLQACSCTINSGVNLSVPSARTLTITNAVTVASGASLTFENNSSLVQINNVANSGSITYKRISPKIRLSDYTYWSSPVTPQTLYNVSQFTLADKYFSFNGNDWVMNPSSTVMQAGKGYIIRGPQTYSDTVGADYPASFVGVPNNGNITGETLEAGKFYLIGNPYPSAIGAFQFLDNNRFMNGTLYFWVHNIPLNPSAGQYEYKSDDYAAFNLTGGVSTYPAPSSTLPGSNNTGRPSGHIAAGQSFFASAATAGTVHFINGMREGAADNTQFFKPGKTSKETATASHIWLNMTNEKGAYKQMLVGYVDGATNDFENRFDGETFDAHPYLDFFSVNNNRTFVIQGRALPFEDTDVVPLGYRSSIAGEFTIAIDETDGELLNQAVYLEDKTTGKIHDLKAGKYTFTTAVGTFTDRLVLRYTNKTLGTGDFENTDNAIVVSVKTKVIKVTSAKENIKAVNIYDISGKLLYSKNKVNATELQIQNLQSANQVLLVKVTLDNDYTVTKKAIFQ